MTGDKIIYLGGCDMVRSATSYHWIEFKDGDLIEGKEYDVTGGFCAQTTWIKVDGVPTIDRTGSRYYYYEIVDELGRSIWAWEEFFKLKDTKKYIYKKLKFSCLVSVMPKPVLICLEFGGCLRLLLKMLHIITILTKKYLQIILV